VARTTAVSNNFEFNGINLKFRTIVIPFNITSPNANLFITYRYNGGVSTDTRVDSENIVTNAGTITFTYYWNNSVSGGNIARGSTRSRYHFLIAICNQDIILEDIRFFANNPSKGYIPYVKLYDHTLTATERLQAYNEWLNRKPKTVAMHPKYPKPIISRDNGLKAHYTFNQSQGQILDISGNNKSFYRTKGSLVNQCCLQVTQGQNVGSLGNIRTVIGRAKIKTNSDKLFEGQTGGVFCNVTSGLLTASNFAGKYVNGTTTLNVANSHVFSFALTNPTDINFSNLTLGLNGSTFSDVQFDELKFYDRELTAEEVKAYHNEWAGKPSFVLPLENY
jgi:hypothetical protein